MHYSFKIILRLILKKPVLSIINFTGFTIGILASLLIYLWVYDQSTFEKFHSDYNRIYRVLTLSKQGEDIIKSAVSYQPIAETIKKDYPQIEAATYLYGSSEDSPLQFENGKKIEARKYYTNTDFFKIFDGFQFLEGNAENAFKHKSNIVLSEKVARKLFGNSSALGKKIVSDKYSENIYTVSAVLKIPRNTHIDFGYLLSEANLNMHHTTNSWRDSYWIRTYIKLSTNAEINDLFLSRISNHISRYSNRTDKLMFQPISEIHLHSDYTTNMLDNKISNYKYVVIFSGLALLILIMVILNFTILSTVSYSEQAKEIGIQKVNGAKRYSLLLQFMMNSFLQTFVAAFFAIALAFVLLPKFNELTGQQLQISLSMQLITYLFLLIVFTAIAAGLYPSIYLSKLNPVQILKAKNYSGGNIGLMNLLIVIQFAIAIFSISVSGVFMKQFHFITTKDLGINHSNMLVVPTGLWYDSNSFKNDLLQNPNILSASASTYAPMYGGFRSNFVVDKNGVKDSIHAVILHVDDEFAKNYELKLTKGKFLNMNYSTYWEEMKKKSDDHTFSFPVVINESAEKLLGFEDPIGQRIGDNEIVGVVKDFHFKSLHHRIEPLVLMNSPENIMTMNIRISQIKRKESIAYIRDTYKKHREDREFSFQFFDDLLEAEYRNENHLKNTTKAFTILSIIISILGMLGIVGFVVRQKTKEIGIRKTNGAKTYEIIQMLNIKFLKWVIIAFVLACPIAWYVMNIWLQNFAYKTELNWWIFALSGIIAMVIAITTVTWQSWRTAKKNPVESLRYE